MSRKSGTLLNNSISSKEYSRIERILENYSIKPENIEAINDMYKILYNNVYYCLRKMKHNKKEEYKNIYFINYLKDNGFDNISDYMKTKDDKLYVRGKKCVYFLSDCIEGRECDVNNISEVNECAKLLAFFHVKSKGFYEKGCGLISNAREWELRFKSERQDLNIFRKIIDSKKVKSSFDSFYEELIGRFIKQMDISIDLLERSGYRHMLNNARIEKCICHDGFNINNLYIDNMGKVYLNSINNIYYGLRVQDLAKFLCKILNKKSYGWNFDIADELIESYASINPLSLEEYQILLAFIIFPHKFWKLGRRRFIKHRKWSEDKYIRKLNKIAQHKNNREVFIERFIKKYIG